MEVDGNLNILVINILQNNLFCDLQKKEMYTGLERHEGSDDRILILRVNHRL